MSELTDNQSAFEAAKPGHGFAKLPSGNYLYEGVQVMFNDWLENNELRKAKAKITELQAEVEALKTELHHSSLAATAEAHEVDRINRELKSLRKDAERYQWLRRMSVGLSLSHQVISQFVTNQGELDAVIAKDTQE